MRSTPKRLAAVGAAAIVLVGGVAAASARSDRGPHLRTAVASTQTVDQLLHTVATIEPVSQATVAFPVAGTVDQVDVEVGGSVTVGQHLASLDVGSLEVTVHEKQAALDQAELTLALALAGEDVGSPSGGSANGGFGRSATAAADAELDAAQQAVVDAQHAVHEAQAAGEAAYQQATTACAGSTTNEGADTTSADETSDACLAALRTALDSQAALTAAQADLAAAVETLTTLIQERASTTTTTTVPSTSTTTSPERPTTSTPGSGSSNATGAGGANGGSAPTSGGSSPTGSDSAGSGPSAEDLIAYQKQVDAAADELAVAEQAVDQATIVSPIDGTVSSVGLAVGDEVEAGSSTANVVVVGEGGFEVTTSISVADLPDVEVGQEASVTPDGAERAIEGEVVRIGVSPSSSSGSTTTYPVTIALTGDTSGLGNGATASVVIVTKAAAKALAVPTSAVTVDGDGSTVQVVRDGKATTKTVETGAVGQSWIEITDGLSAGDEVVLADLDEPLPGSATDGSSTGTSREGPGGFTISGGPPAGFTAGGPPGGN